MRKLTPEERIELEALRADVRSLRELLEGPRDRLDVRAANRERRRRRINRLSFGLFGRG